MLFNSIDFWVFYAVVLLAYALVPSRWRWATLLVASYAFYMQWNASYIVLILLSTLVDYACGLAMARVEDARRRRRTLLISLGTNLGLLFTFKYWGFFHDSLADLLGLLSIRYAPPELSVLLPVGISFYTFQTLSYTIDVYRGQMEPERHLGRFALYVSFFPQLVAGPIERAGRLLPQLGSPGSLRFASWASGMQLAAWGLFKKVVIADRVGIYVDAVYGSPEVHSGPTLVLATYLFAFQIYCDFSGYSDIAIGVARSLGFDLMRNFDRPYLATSIRDFWRRWHISLSSWLRDYLYIPLGGSRGGALLTYRNLMITMLLGGLWHGAAWPFVIWGGIQGALLSWSRATLEWRTQWWSRLGVPARIRDLVRVGVCFQLVCFSWIFFRAPTLDVALTVLRRIAVDPFGTLWVDRLTLAHAAIGLSTLIAVELVQTARPGWLVTPAPALRLAAWYGIAVGILLLGVEQGAQFIYFQF